MTAMPELTTERLVVRPFTAADLKALLELPGLGADDDAGVERTRRFVQWAELHHDVLADLRQPPYGDRAVVLRDTGTLIGAVGFVPALAPFGQLPSFRSHGAAEDRRFTPEVGLYWAITPAQRRRGFATEAARALVRHAFDRMRVVRLIAMTEHDNVASIAVMRRLGMRIERNPRPEPAWFQTVGVLDNDRTTAAGR